VADGSWGNTSSADSKIIALTTQVNGFKQQLKNAAGGKSTTMRNKSVVKSSEKGNKEPSNKWWYTKVGKTTRDPVTGTTV
jgi:hypothetical protein